MYRKIVEAIISILGTLENQRNTIQLNNARSKQMVEIKINIICEPKSKLLPPF